MCKCLYCYRELREGQVDYHPECAKRMFGTPVAPVLDYTQQDMLRLAAEVIRSRTTLTGVQAKLSLQQVNDHGTRRLTIVGLWGDYVFKPQTEEFAQLPEVEDVTMHLAQIARLNVANHALIRLADGGLGYITRRFDRVGKGEKIATEDGCQLSERRTEDKYRSSYEQLAKVIRRYSSMPQLDVTNFFEIVLFNWLTGNNDAHLKNFSLYRLNQQVRLAPAYDLVNAVIVNPKDKEETALTLNGKKTKIRYTDFQQAALRSGLPEHFIRQTVERYASLLPAWMACVDASFLSVELKAAYKALLTERIERMREEME